ncbi:SCO family protein [Aliikangiella sp. G2MR2-5]|uniref:SCO family protein n=1 Tax=Aliikangiella sp. G2MR2-5 TaxID=2788943 RepID=UPI0018A9FD83|nr:SCO family protein [Aliikangiella sp. G2MR2-5]
MKTNLTVNLRSALFLVFTLLGSWSFIGDVLGEEYSSRYKVPDIEVLDQFGNHHRFYSDLVKGKTVVINFIFTQCQMTCPLLGYNFGQLRELLAASAGEEIHLISISIDPTNDTPSRLKAWSDNFGSGKGWTQITGEKVEIDRLVKALQAFTPDIGDHSTMVLIGREDKNEWVRLDGLSSGKKLFSAIKANFHG